MFKIVFYRTLFSQSAASLTAGYLSAYIRQNDIPVRMELLEKGRMDNSIKVMAQYEKFPVIIYKCNFQDYDEGMELLSYVKNVSNKCKIFVMGYFAEINARQMMERYRFIDGVVYGDGCTFCIRYAKSGGRELIGGLFRNADGSLIEDKQHIFIPLNKLPNPARDIERQEKGTYINIIWREGCFGTCKFCHINLVKRPFSERSVDAVVEEIEDCCVKMGKRMFFFNDSVFWWGEQDDDKLDRFIYLIEQKKLDINFMIYLRCQPFIGAERLKRLKEIGLRRVFIGIENISDSFHGDYNKVSGKKTEVLEIMQELNISYHIGFILFHPSVTVPELVANIEYLYGLKKLYRWGVIIEKMRIIPVERLDREYDVEGKIDVAYDYSFHDEEVTKIFNVLRRFTNLFDVRDFENICTSTLLLMNLYSNKYTEIEPKEFVCFRDEIKKYNSFAIGLFRDLFEVYKNLSEDELFKYIKNKFIKENGDYYYSLQIKRGLVYDYVNKKDNDLHLRVFHGQRRLNGYE